ncbi:MAG TPA: cupredoxin family copper-binding protein [Patescibacteria group bacterium]|nr:cupredoxin family copper-binding protein [Patescibacteria group bacterium]
MNKIIIVIIVLIIVIGGGYFLMKSYSKGSSEMNMQQNTTTNESTQAPTSGNAVTIKNFAFGPETLTVKVGDKVTWTNQDSTGHSATADDNSWDTGVLPQGQSGSITFSKAGTYTYHCSVHPSMKGTIIVK